MSDQDHLTVEQTTIDLSYLDENEQFDFFSDELCRRYISHDAKIIGDRKDFPARIDSLEMGSSLCALIKAPLYALNRTRKNIAQDYRDDFFLMYMLSGMMEFQSEDRRSRSGPGGILLLDNSVPLSFETKSDSGYRAALSVRLNRDEYSDIASQKALSNENLFSHHRLSKLLNTSLAQLSASVNSANDMESATLLDVVETLVGLIVRDQSVESVALESDSAFQLVDAEISRQLQDNRLSQETVAHHLGLSVGQVEQIMVERSTSFSDFVREERLSLAMGRLCDEKHSGRTIEQVAQACGFNEMSNFYQAFKDAFQRTPGEVRRASVRPRHMN